MTNLQIDKISRNKGLKVLFFVFVFGIFATKAVAALKCPPWLPAILCDEEGNMLLDINSIVRMFLYLIIIAALLWTIWHLSVAGFVWISSGGDEEKRNEAIQKIISALAGLVIVLVSFTMMAIVMAFFGFSTGEASVGIPCTTDEGTTGLWSKENDLDGDMEIDQNECVEIQ